MRRGEFVNLLLDEMYAGLKEYFETLGWEVLTVQEIGLKGAKDKDIVDYAKKNTLLLVTQDQRSAELADLIGVRCVLISNAMIAKIADANPWMFSFASGGDFQFIVTTAVSARRQMCGMRFIEIGRITKSRELLLVLPNGKTTRLPTKGHRDSRRMTFGEEIDYLIRSK